MWLRQDHAWILEHRAGGVSNKVVGVWFDFSSATVLFPSRDRKGAEYRKTGSPFWKRLEPLVPCLTNCASIITIDSAGFSQWARSRRLKPTVQFGLSAPARSTVCTLFCELMTDGPIFRLGKSLLRDR